MKMRVTFSDGVWESDEISGMSEETLRNEINELEAKGDPIEDYELVGGTEADREVFELVNNHECFGPTRVLDLLWHLSRDDTMLLHFILVQERDNGYLDDDSEIERALEIFNADEPWECWQHERPFYVVGIGETKEEAAAECCKNRHIPSLFGIPEHAVDWKIAAEADRPVKFREVGGKHYAYDKAVNPTED